MIQFTLWAIPSLFGFILVGSVFAHVWPQRSEPGATAFLYLSGATAWWLLCQFVALFMATLEPKLFMAQLQYVGIATAPLAWFAYAVLYTGRGRPLRSWPIALIYGVTATTVLLAFTNGSHGLLWAEASLIHARGYAGLILEHGPWFRVHLGTSYALIAVATGLLGLHIAQSPRHWSRLVFVLGAPMALMIPSLIYLTPLQPAEWVDLTPTGLAVANGLLGWGLMRKGMFDFAPVARTIVVEEMRDCVIVVDRSGRIVDVNRAASDLLGVRVQGPVPIDLGTAWVSARAIGDGEASEPVGIQLRTTDERVRNFEMSVAALGPQGGRGRSVLVLRDITERMKIENELREAKTQLEQVNGELERRANTDGLTGLANRRFFLEVLDREIERADRYGRPLALIMLDLDHFKRVNDNYGHAAGDAVLKAAAAALNRVSRDTDLPARLGGEELALLLPETHVEGASQVAERLRTLIAAERHLSPHGTDFSVTSSFGVASHLAGDGEADELMQRADEALYKAKATGRDRVVTVDSPQRVEPRDQS